MNKKKSFDVTELQAKELEEIVRRSGLSLSEYIRKRVLPSCGCRIIFLDGAKILEKLGQLFEYVQSGTDLSQTVSELFDEFGKLYDRLIEIERNNREKEA